MVAPVYSVMPASVKIPVPILMREPVPDMFPEKVAELLLPPVVRVLPDSATMEGPPVSEPMVSDT